MPRPDLFLLPLHRQLLSPRPGAQRTATKTGPSREHTYGTSCGTRRRRFPRRRFLPPLRGQSDDAPTVTTGAILLDVVIADTPAASDDEINRTKTHTNLCVPPTFCSVSRSGARSCTQRGKKAMMTPERAEGATRLLLRRTTQQRKQGRKEKRRARERSTDAVTGALRATAARMHRTAQMSRSGATYVIVDIRAEARRIRCPC